MLIISQWPAQCLVYGSSSKNICWINGKGEKANLSFFYTRHTGQLQNVNGLLSNELVKWKDKKKTPKIILLSSFLAALRWLVSFADYYTTRYRLLYYYCSYKMNAKTSEVMVTYLC